MGGGRDAVLSEETPPRALLCPRRFWLGWQDSNLRMPESKSGALPLGDIPMSGSVVKPTFSRSRGASEIEKWGE